MSRGDVSAGESYGSELHECDDGSLIAPPNVNPELFAAYHALPDLELRGYEIILPKRITMEGMRYWPRDVRDGVPISRDGQLMIDNAYYDGWDLLVMPQGGGAHHALVGDYVRLLLSRACTVGVMLVGGTGIDPAGFDDAGWGIGPNVRRQYRFSGRATVERVRLKRFEAGSVIIPAMNRLLNGNTVDYYVIMIGGPEGGAPPAVAATAGGFSLPPAGSVVTLDHWQHSMHQVQSFDGTWSRSWHPQQDRKTGAFYNHDHRSDPNEFLLGAWLPGEVGARINPAPKWGFTAGMFGIQEDPFGYKVIPWVSPEDDCEILFVVWWPTSTSRRFRNARTTLDVVVKRISTNEIVGVFHRAVRTNHVRWAFPDSGSASDDNLLPRNVIPAGWAAIQNVPVALDGSGYWTTQYRFLGASDPLVGGVVLAVDDPMKKAVVRWARSGVPRVGGRGVHRGDIITNIGWMLPLKRIDLQWFSVRGDVQHHAPVAPNPDKEFGTESWGIVGEHQFIGVDTLRVGAASGVLGGGKRPLEYAKPGTRLGIMGAGRFAPVSHFFDSRYRRTLPGEEFQRFDRNVGGVINAESTN